MLAECRHGLEWGCVICTPSEVTDCRTGTHNTHAGHDGGRYWSAFEDAFIRAHWEEMDDLQLAQELERSRSSVEHHRTRMGLHRAHGNQHNH